MSDLATTTVTSPVGTIAVGATRAGLAFVGLGGPEPPAPTAAAGADVLDEARRQLLAYFAGELREFALPLAPRGTAFQRRAWAEIARVPYGATTTYGDIARRLGHRGSGRAVGVAVGRNPIAIIVPCHRVVGADGRLTGYAGGLDRKRFLLSLERSRDPEGLGTGAAYSSSNQMSSS
jgi:methylated-DNA-[protein]-cysteine S-methyltransferase